MPGVDRTRSLVCKQKTHELVTTGTPFTSAFPAQWRYGLYRALLGVPGFVATVARGIITRKLDTSVGVSGPHDFAVRIGRTRLTPPIRPSHPASHVRDDRDTPLLMEAGWMKTSTNFRKTEEKYFTAEGWSSRSI